MRHRFFWNPGERAHSDRVTVGFGSPRRDDSGPGAGLIACMFDAIWSAVLGLMHAYVWKRLIKDTTAPGRNRWNLTAVLLAWPAWQPHRDTQQYVSRGRRVPGSAGRGRCAAGYLCAHAERRDLAVLTWGRWTSTSSSR